MRLTRILFCFLLVTVSSFLRADAQITQRLSLSEAIQRTQERSPLTQGVSARIFGAAARLRGAGAFANPTLSLAQPFGQNTGGTDEDILLAQTFELGDKLRQRVHAARAERDAALTERTQNANELAFAAQSTYFEALRAEAERQLATDLLKNAQTFATAAETQFQAGDAPRSNVVRSRIELARAEQSMSVAETERANRYATLRSLTRVPETAELVLTDNLVFAPVHYELNALQALAIRRRPELRSAQYLRSARDAALHAARAQSQPDLFLEARHSTLDPTIGGNTLRVGILFPLFDLGRIRADARVARASLQEQEATLLETERTVRLDVETAFNTLAQAQRVVESFQSGRLGRARELLEMAQTGYDKGANSYIELLDAQQIYRSEQADYLRALAAFNIAKATLQRAVGGSLP